jgi:hypothetical protein
MKYLSLINWLPKIQPLRFFLLSDPFHKDQEYGSAQKNKPAPFRNRFMVYFPGIQEAELIFTYYIIFPANNITFAV